MRMKSNGGAGGRAWNLLRVSALLWARKGGVLRRRLEMDLRVLPKFIKNLGGGGGGREAVWYGERQLSFEETPIFNVKIPRPGSMRFRMPHIPCINPSVDFDFDCDFEDDRREDALIPCTQIVSLEEESVDLRAEEFIDKFHQQMKLQRQISYLQYRERLDRGTC